MKSTVVTWIALLALGGAVGWQVHRNGKLQDELAALSGQVEASRAEMKSARVDDPGGPALENGERARLLSGLQAQVERLQTEVERVASASAASTGGKGMPGGDVPAAAVDLTERPQFRDAVRSVVLDLTDDMVFRQKLGGQVGRMDLGKNAPFAKLADTLKLDTTQEDKFRKDLMTLKEDVMLLLTETRDDEVDMMAEIQQVEALGENDPKRAKTFMKLFTLKVPGQDQSYWDRIVKMQAAFRARTDDYLSTEQVEIFNAVKVDILSVDVE